MNAVNVWGLHIISFTQSSCSGCGNFFTFLSNVAGNPSALYSVYFPVVYGFDSQLAVKLLQAAVAGDWINLVMKWMLMGHRPYWWVHEAKLAQDINVQQFYNTCETGPGNPSGHVAITGITWFILFQAVIERVEKKYKRDIRIPAWTFYTVSMTLLGLSRVYIAAHFPHQCLFGFACAVLTGKLISRLNLESLNIRHYFIAAAVSVSSVLVLHCFLEVIGVDVNWTIRLARQWCVKPEWVHLSTSPYYILWRFTGVLLGTGVMINSKVYKRLRTANLSTGMRTALSVSGLLITNLLSKCTPVSMENPLMYLVECLFHSALICVVGIGIPLCLKL